MRGGERHHRRARVAVDRAGRDAHAHGAVRADELARLLQRLADHLERARLADRAAVIGVAQLRHGIGRDGERALRLQLVHQRGDGGAVLAIGPEQRALEVRADLDVHRGADRGGDAVLGVIARLQAAVENVVLVRRNHQPLDRQAHLLRQEAREDVAEIAGRHGEADLAMRRAKRHGRGEEIDDLRQHPGEVDRIHAGKAHFVAEGEVVEHVLQLALAIVEIAVDGQRVDIALNGRRHLPALHLAHPAMREEDEDIDIVETAEGLDRGRAGVARGGADDGDAAALFRQLDLEQLADHLHREILEREGRAVEQLKQEMVRRELLERRARGMAKARIGARDGALQLGLGEGVAGEGAHHPEGDLLIAQPGKRRDLVRGHHRHGFRHIEPAVPCKARQHRLAEAQNRGLPPGGDIAHLSPFNSVPA
ncbi:hypothetical protein SDC9_21337 [bioreactor metagenome]|uniref:Uncharacterized protein n=1 Tax=bioreactor metagenome TaxID=1076179 RepID=A0A644U9J4_9ZZZZ